MSNWKPTWCNGEDHIWRPDRRQFLHVGVVGALGLTLGNLLKLEALAGTGGTTAGGAAKAKSIINIYLPGGMAAQETLDPKMFWSRVIVNQHRKRSILAGSLRPRRSARSCVTR